MNDNDCKAVETHMIICASVGDYIVELNIG